jgi:hypothetical protein
MKTYKFLFLIPIFFISCNPDNQILSEVIEYRAASNDCYRKGKLVQPGTAEFEKYCSPESDPDKWCCRLKFKDKCCLHLVSEGVGGNNNESAFQVDGEPDTLYGTPNFNEYVIEGDSIGMFWIN